MSPQFVGWILGFKYSNSINLLMALQRLFSWNPSLEFYNYRFLHHKLRLVTSLIGTAKSSSLATKTWLRVKPWRFPRRHWNYRVDCNIYILVGNVGVCQRTSPSVFGRADLTLRSLHMTFEWLFAAVFLHQHKFRTIVWNSSLCQTALLCIRL